MKLGSVVPVPGGSLGTRRAWGANRAWSSWRTRRTWGACDGDIAQYLIA